MSVTIQPVFEALGIRDARQQRDLVKLLHAAGAYGRLPGVSGVLSDRQAQAVLTHVTFDNVKQAAHWLHDATQKHFIRRPSGAERCDCQEPREFVQHRAELLSAVRNIGMLADIKPERKHYDHVLVLGAMEDTAGDRLDTLAELANAGVTFGRVHLLGSHRELDPRHESCAGTVGPDGNPICTEMQMMQAQYYHKAEHWPDSLRNARVFAVDSYNKENGARANTQDTIRAWEKTEQKQGSVLVISNQPYVRYQHEAVKSVLPDAYKVETVGAGASGRLKVSVALDSLARQIDVGFPKLLERLTSRNFSMQTPLVMLAPENIKVDAATYQFRSGGDGKSGVTKKGRYRASRWDPLLHGDPVLVHERSDGTMYIADGHHRLDLARELNAKGAGPGQIAAMVLREADGYSALDVKVIAAYRNIAHGKCDVVDTARVFKEAYGGKMHTELLPQLQMDKGNLRIAFTISKLSDKALDYVARGDVPAEMAAKVAQEIPDNAKRQESVMGMVSEKLHQRKYQLKQPHFDTQPGPSHPTATHVNFFNFGHMENNFINTAGFADKVLSDRGHSLTPAAALR